LVRKLLCRQEDGPSIGKFDSGEETLRPEEAMATVPKPRYTPEEYLGLERHAEHKSEYFAGEIFATAGASRVHNRIAFNIAGALYSQLRGTSCQGFNSDMRVRVKATGLYTYPNIAVACGELLFDDEQGDTLLNPTLIVEILSPSTEAYDRGDKFAQYRRLESLQEYVLVALDRCGVERFARQPDGQWLLLEAADPSATVHLASISGDLKLAEVYDRVELPGRETGAPGSPAEPPAPQDVP
jgi:Uma2 family endonuclease